MGHTISYSDANKAKSKDFDYPKLKLEKDETARILMIEKEPAAEYVYTLRAPVLENGEPVYETKVTRKGEEYQTKKMRFVSRPIALGDFNVLQDGGLDPDHDIIGAYATKHPDRVQAPQRRFATNVIRYKTAKKGRPEVAKPFSVDLLVWSFTDKVFSKLVDFHQEWDLHKHDLILGPCTNPVYQQFDISVASSAAFLEKDEYKQLVLDTYKNQRIDDLSIACGQKKEPRFIQMDLDEISEAWDDLSRYESRQKGLDVVDLKASTSDDTSLASDLGDLLADDGSIDADKAFPASEAPKSEVSSDGLDLDDLLDNEGPELESEQESEPETKKKEKAKPEVDVEGDFDALLADL